MKNSTRIALTVIGYLIGYAISFLLLGLFIAAIVKFVQWII